MMNTPQITVFAHEGRSEVWYFMGKGRLDEAQKAIDEWSAKQPDNSELPSTKALLLAVKRRFSRRGGRNSDRP